MKLILFFCLCVLAFSQSLESQNEELKLKNKLLLKTLRELAVGEKAAESAEITIGQGEEQVADDGGCYNRCREAGGSQSECASDCPMPDEIVAQHEQSTEEEVGGNQWQCHRYGSGESDSWCQSAGDPFVFTRGNNAAYPGCGGCWCCMRKEWPCRSTNKVGHNRSISPGDICNTDWTHVTYWRARHEYCKNDKGNWGCEYGYKRVGWNDYCCNQWESRNTNRCQCR